MNRKEIIRDLLEKNSSTNTTSVYYPTEYREAIGYTDYVGKGKLWVRCNPPEFFEHLDKLNKQENVNAKQGTRNPFNGELKEVKEPIKKEAKEKKVKKAKETKETLVTA